jgi:hypothetical protein
MYFSTSEPNTFFKHPAYQDTSDALRTFFRTAHPVLAASARRRHTYYEKNHENLSISSELETSKTSREEFGYFLPGNNGELQEAGQP